MTWLRSNRWYLVAVAVLLPAALFAAASTDWFRYIENLNGKPIEASQFDTVEYANNTWSLLEYRSFDSSSQAGANAGLVAGTELVTATFAVTPPPAGSGTTCEFTLFDASGTKEWDAASNSDVDFDIVEGAENYCQPDALDPYKLQVFFVVPEGTATGASLHLIALVEYPAYVRFAL